MSETSTRNSLLLPISTIAAIIVLLIVGFFLFLKGPSTISIEVTGEEGKEFLGTFTVDGQPQKRSGTIPATFTFKTNSLSCVIVPAKNEQDGPEIAVVGIGLKIRENEKDRGSASGIHGVKALFDRTSGSLKIVNASLTPEEREAELATHQ